MRWSRYLGKFLRTPALLLVWIELDDKRPTLKDTIALCGDVITIRISVYLSLSYDLRKKLQLSGYDGGEMQL